MASNPLFPTPAPTQTTQPMPTHEPGEEVPPLGTKKQHKRYYMTDIFPDDAVIIQVCVATTNNSLEL
jgi:hypothetical protein